MAQHHDQWQALGERPELGPRGVEGGAAHEPISRSPRWTRFEDVQYATGPFP